MAIYSFVTDDGEEYERSFPMGACPSFIKLDDGTVAKRSFVYVGFNFRDGFLPPTATMKRKEDMTRKNISAGEKGRDYWKSKNPKLVSP